MLNMIKMDLFTMIRTKSLYIITVIMLFLCFINIGLPKILSETMTPEALESMNSQVTSAQAELPEGFHVGIQCDTSILFGDSMEMAYDETFFMTAQSHMLILFMTIFVVIFTGMDRKNGYIKNIYNHVQNKHLFILSKAVSIFIYALCTYILSLVFLILSTWILYGKHPLADPDAFWIYVVITFFLHYVFLMIIMAFTLLINNTVGAMSLGMIFNINLIGSIYLLLDNIIHKFISEDFSISEYMISSQIGAFTLSASHKECMTAIFSCIIFFLIAFVAACVINKKRDI